jgi:hypothetical protein
LLHRLRFSTRFIEHSLDLRIITPFLLRTELIDVPLKIRERVVCEGRGEREEPYSAHNRYRRT